MNDRMRAARSFVRSGAQAGVGRRSNRSIRRLMQGDAAGALRNDFGGWLGYGFTSAAAVTVTALSRWALVANTASHSVKIWSDAGVELAAATVDCSSVLADGWVDMVITPFVLPAGSYIIGSQETAAGDQWHTESASTLAAGFTIGRGQYGDGSYPAIPSGFGTAFIPVSFQFRA